MSPLSREAILALLSGLTALGCDKSQTQATPEPGPSAAAAPAAALATPAASAAPAPSAGIKEVTPATSKPTEKEKGCAPGGCAPGQCGANK
ncbi:MAG TPA: hypothetical protein VJN18_36125 [Polyangiaceae bacterium]|nr:hypothetical protein [Polyangiaceae bacterium]